VNSPFWVVEMQGKYLGVRKFSTSSEFFWKNDIKNALRFESKEQSGAFMDALRDTLGPHRDELFPPVCEWGAS
jgi:hypothetical protein